MVDETHKIIIKKTLYMQKVTNFGYGLKITNGISFLC